MKQSEEATRRWRQYEANQPQLDDAVITQTEMLTIWSKIDQTCPRAVSLYSALCISLGTGLRLATILPFTTNTFDVTEKARGSSEPGPKEYRSSNGSPGCGLLQAAVLPKQEVATPVPLCSRLEDD